MGHVLELVMRVAAASSKTSVISNSKRCNVSFGVFRNHPPMHNLKIFLGEGCIAMRPTRSNVLSTRIIFNQILEPQQPFIPLSVQQFEPLFQFAEWSRGKGIALFPPDLMNGHQTFILKDIKMFENTLPCNGKFAGKLGGCLGTILGKIHQ